MARFGSVLTAMITPFDEAGELDVDVAARLARWLVDQGNQGLVVAGTTGESPTITLAEQARLFGVVREAVTVPVVAGVGSNSTRESLELLAAAEAAGVDGVLVVTPYYNRPSQAGLLRHFRTIAEATELPVMLYDIPVRTGRKIDTNTLIELAQTVPNIVALKDAAGSPADTARVIAEVPDSFEVYSGDDGLTLPLLAVGAVGVVGVATHWAAAEMAELIAAFHKGDVERARRLNEVLLDSYDYETGLVAPNPVPAKAMLRTLGWAVGECRPPMGPTPEGLEDRARKVMAHLAAARAGVSARRSDRSNAPQVEDGGGAMPTPVSIAFLGGLGEIGRNCAVFECDGTMVLLDCGLMFPGADMPGIDLVLPDFSYILEHAEQVAAVILTHGHEDHVGGLAYLLRELSVPLYGSPFTLGLARNRIEEAGLVGRTSFHPTGDGERIRIGPFDIELIPMTHSVPSGNAVAFHTPQGIILHSGDFKLDTTPVDGRLSDLARIGALSAGEGIRLLLADSTNADEPGWAVSESKVGGALYDLFHEHAERRIITVCFSSHIHRIQQIADAAIEQGRVVATLGLSMRKNVRLARSMRLLDIPERSLVDIEQVDGLDPGQVCVISTGSQGEPYSALALMASNQNRFIKLAPDDTVILSSHPIPGNEANVSRVMNGLVRLGAEVVHTGIADVHSSGHAKQEELRLFHNLTRPEWFVPVHGEARHLAAHARLAEEVGLAADRTLVCEDGDQVVLTDGGLLRGERVRAGHLYVDGIVGDVGRGVLRDRRVLAEEGVVVVIVAVDTQERVVVSGPELITRGWVYAPEAEDLLDEAVSAVRREVEEALAAAPVELEALQQRIRRAAGRFVNERTRRKPMIVPVVLEV